MSLYLNLLDEAVAKQDLSATRARICNLIVEKNGLSGKDILRIVTDIEIKFSGAGIQLFASPDKNVETDALTDKERFRQEVANLNLNFSRERIEIACRLKDNVSESSKQTVQVPQLQISSRTLPRAKSVKPSSSYGAPKRPTHRSAKSTSKQNINIARGAIVGGAVGLVAGAICHAAIVGLIVGCAAGGAIGYNYSKKTR